MWWKRFGMSVVFDQDPNNPDANKPDVGDDPSKAGNNGGGGADDSKKDQTFDLDIGGEKRTVTLEEMKTLATKSAGADAKFQNAASMRKEAEKGLRISTLIGNLQSETPSEDEAKELAALLGLDAGEFMEYLNEDDDGQAQQKNQPPQKMSKEDIAAGLKELGFDVNEAKEILTFSKARHVEAARQEIRKISDDAVDKDEVFGKMIVGDKAKDRQEVIKSMVAEDVLGKIKDGEPFGAEMVAKSVQKIRSHLTRFGIPGKPDLYPISLGQGPGVGLPAEIQAEEPIKRIAASEEGAEKNFIHRWMQKAYQKSLEARRS